MPRSPRWARAAHSEIGHANSLSQKILQINKSLTDLTHPLMQHAGVRSVTGAQRYGRSIVIRDVCILNDGFGMIFEFRK